MWKYFYNNKEITSEEADKLSLSKDNNGNYRTMFSLNNDKANKHAFFIYDNDFKSNKKINYNGVIGG